MARMHATSALTVLFTVLICRMLSIEGRGIKSPNTPQKTSTHLPSRSPTVSSLLSASAVASLNDFRPTGPGLSPGAGHSDINNNVKDEQKNCLNDKCTEDFRPTAPGDSPGAGHSSVNNDRNASEQGAHLKVAHTQAGQDK